MPALAVQRFVDRLARGKPLPSILLLGSDDYLRDLCRSKLVEAYLPEGARQWGVTRFSAAGDDFGRIFTQAQTRPMLSPCRVVFVEEIEAWEKLGDEAREELLRHLEEYLNDPAPFTVLVLEARALDQRMKLFKLLSEKAQVVALELGTKPEDRGEVVLLMTQQMARGLGAEFDRDAAEELVDLLDGELARICVEVEKLATYVGSQRRISRADVDALVVSAKKYSVWQLAEILAGGQRAQAIEFLDSLLREGEQPAALVGAMAWMYRKLIEAQELPALSAWQAAGRLGMRPESAELALRQSRRIPRAQLLAGLTALYEADSRLKSGSVDHRAVMEFLVARLTAAAAPRADRGWVEANNLAPR
jgi:DNA polymerase-3 subunit delta